MRADAVVDPIAALRKLARGKRQLLVVYESCEPVALQREAEVTDGEEKPHELPVQSAGLPFTVAELPAEKGQRLQPTAHTQSEAAVVKSH